MPALDIIIGNGYNCSCCRHVSYETIPFVLDEDGINGLIEDCIQYYRYDEDVSFDADDFSLDKFEDCSLTEEEWDEWRFMMTDRIHQAMKNSAKIQKIQKEIKYQEDNINDVNKWFNTLDQIKDDKIALRVKSEIKLAELQQELEKVKNGN